MPDEPGRELLLRFVQGDRDAFEALFHQFERDVYLWILRIVRDRSAAEDVLVEAFWRCYHARARFDAARSFGAWMRTIATHAALDELKARRRRRWLAAGDAHGEWRRGATPGPGASEAVPDAMLRQSVARAFASLPPRLQVVATLALVEERPHAEIAAALGLPIGTVKSRLFRATRLLRKELARAGVKT
jgi:RNA polymerase sigma-70 factor (ECF subfamily)